MNVNLTHGQLELIIRSMKKYARALSVDAGNNFFGLQRDEMISESNDVAELLDILCYEEKSFNTSPEVFEEDTNVPIKKIVTATQAVSPYEEWSPNDPRNW